MTIIRKRILVIIAMVHTILLLLNIAFGEDEYWKCPACGNEKNIVSFCENCGFSKPESFFINVLKGTDGIEWYVLDIQDGKALLITQYGLITMDYKYFIDSDFTYCPWRDSTVRAWLNKVFFENAFTQGEQGVIQTNVVHNGLDENVYYEENSQEGGMYYPMRAALGRGEIRESDFEDTIDSVFLLNSREYYDLLYDKEKVDTSSYPAFAYYEKYEYKGALDCLDGFGGYWLRDSYLTEYGLEASVVYPWDFHMYIDASNEGEPMSVRPCIVIDLEKYIKMHNDKGMQGKHFSVGDTIVIGHFNRNAYEQR